MKYKTLILLLIASNAHAGTFTCTDSAKHLSPLLQVNYRFRTIFEGDQIIAGQFKLSTLNGDISGSVAGINDGMTGREFLYQLQR
jgi:hypothetical protein